VGCNERQQTESACTRPLSALQQPAANCITPRQAGTLTVRTGVRPSWPRTAAAGGGWSTSARPIGLLRFRWRLRRRTCNIHWRGRAARPQRAGCMLRRARRRLAQQDVNHGLGGVSSVYRPEKGNPSCSRNATPKTARTELVSLLGGQTRRAHGPAPRSQPRGEPEQPPADAKCSCATEVSPAAHRSPARRTLSELAEGVLGAHAPESRILTGHAGTPHAGPAGGSVAL
jgi:hypothetical protein